MKHIRNSLLFAGTVILLLACDRTPSAEYDARKVIVDRWLALRDDPDIVDWCVDPLKNTDLHITKTDSGLQATLSVTHFQGRFTAKYSFEFMNGIWVLLRSEQRAPHLIDAKIRKIMSGEAQEK